MKMVRRPRGSRALLALAFLLALLGPGGSASGDGGAEASGSLTARPLAGVEQGLLRDHPGGSLLLAGGKRDSRERPGVALLGVLAAVVAVAAAPLAAAVRPADRPGDRRHSAAAGPRAPPLLQLA
jgi:hypothetical protein